MRIFRNPLGNRAGLIGKDLHGLETSNRSGASDEATRAEADGSQGLLERRRHNDSGLTTLEWLLIVAAVAGLAALAVVLVTNVVSDTSEQISGQSARLTAAEIAADELTTKARGEATLMTDADGNAKAVALNAKYKSDCNELRIIYGDVENLKVNWAADTAGGTRTAPPTAVVDVTTGAGWNADTQGCHIHVTP